MVIIRCRIKKQIDWYMWRHCTPTQKLNIRKLRKINAKNEEINIYLKKLMRLQSRAVHQHQKSTVSTRIRSITFRGLKWIIHNWKINFICLISTLLYHKCNKIGTEQVDHFLRLLFWLPRMLWTSPNFYKMMELIAGEQNRNLEACVSPNNALDNSYIFLIYSLYNFLLIIFIPVLISVMNSWYLLYCNWQYKSLLIFLKLDLLDLIIAIMLSI